MSLSETHTNYMTQALALAEQGRYTVSPNPMVGCIIVKNGSIIAQGYHERAGGPHAEIQALRMAGAHARGATVYLTLEPCAHHGKTPPCVLALIEAGVSSVMVATRDPNPLVSGRGIAALKAAGITVEEGILEPPARQLNEIFFHFMTHRRPFVIAKWAMSLDGKTTTHPNDTRDISSLNSQQTAHDIRQRVDAIIIGAKTAIHDNPLLTVRQTTNPIRAFKQPLRIILSSQGVLPTHLRLFDQDAPAPTLVATTVHQPTLPRHIEQCVLPKNAGGQIDLLALLNMLGQRNITSVLVEGGMTLHESFFHEKLINQIQVYLAPVIIGSLHKKAPLQQLQVTSLGHDLLLTARPPEVTYV